jgi:NAD(P)-dependent dehydrogenase (short-subunit alcohol dehydrogenase family)
MNLKQKRPLMKLEKKVAVIYGATGAVGNAIATAFAAEGAQVFLTGRTPKALDTLADKIRDNGGHVHTDRVDALDEQNVERHMSALIERTGRVDISFNAIGIPQQGIQGIPLLQLSVESFCLPAASYLRSHFLTARAAAKHMVERRAGVILMHTPSPAPLGMPFVGGMGPAWAAMEGLNRSLSAELAPYGVRSLCVRTTGLIETRTIDTVYGLHAQALGIDRQQFQAMVESTSHRKRSTTLDELTETAVFLASDGASAMTGTVANLTGGMVVD